MRTFLFAAAFGMIASPVFANDVFGVWKSEPSDEGAYIHVKIGPCESDAAKVCGKIIETFNGTGERDIVGRLIIENMEPDGENEWDNGTIWAPDDDETYSSEMELKNKNTLEVSGCVLGGIICRGQDWTRVK